MRLKWKLRQNVKVTSTVLLMAFGGGKKGYSQNTTHTVMEVRAEVVSGTNYIDKTISNITDQIQSGSEQFTFGNFQLSIPEGTEYLIDQNLSIKMQDNFNEWHIVTDLQYEQNKDGKITLHLAGMSTTNIPVGNFEGEHTTRIEYN